MDRLRLSRVQHVLAIVNHLFLNAGHVARGLRYMLKLPQGYRGPESLHYLATSTPWSCFFLGLKGD